ncbi:MAG: tRNA pseudouridine(38-40) synthase TruA [Bacillota bacterium]|nr:MAG: tRNA pseudouridine(38-40) synthase TruA [Bacillota bacterium]
MIVKLLVEYDGTGYCGWQVQPNGDTVQAEIEGALLALTGEKISLTGSGRTDSGVHAKGQVASFSVSAENIPPEKYAPALNALLPPDIRILKSERAAEDFNARFSAKRKTYRYTFYVSDVVRPLYERYAARSGPLDVARMRAAAGLFAGERDFKSFCAANSSVKDTVRTIYRCEVEQEGDFVTLTVCGNGFLYNMVRIMAGTLAEVGEGRLSEEDVEKILAGKKRGKGRTAPAKGLCLMSVEYGA